MRQIRDIYMATIKKGRAYHLIDEKDKIKTAQELKRVIKPNGILIVAGISLFGVIRTVLIRYPEELIDEKHDEVFESGIHRVSIHEYDGESFPDAFFWKPLELKEFLEEQGFETLEMAACEGIFSHLREAVNEVSKDRRKWHKIIELAIKTSNDPTIIGSTEHFLWIGKNRDPKMNSI